MKQLLSIVSIFLFVTGISTAQDMAVTSTTPSDTASWQELDANITVTFDEDIASASANSNSITVVGSSSGNLSTGVNYSVSGSTVTLNPGVEFDYSETITVTVTTQVQSLATYTVEEVSGIPADLVSDYVFTFSTKGGPPQPAVVSTSPSNSAFDIGVDQVMSITFDTTMAGNGFDEGVIEIYGSIGGNYNFDDYEAGENIGDIDISGSGATVSIDLDSSFVTGEIVTVILTTGVSSYNDERSEYGFMAAPYVFQFQVGSTDNNALVKVDSSYTASTSPLGIAFADMDNDGDTDIVTANSAGNTISVFANDGTGVFGTPTNSNTSSTQPSYLVVADFNQDGYEDVVVSSVASDDISILLSNSGSGFYGASTQSVGDAPRAITTGDFNGDGKLDLAVSLSSDGEVAVLINNYSQSTSGFTGPTDYTVASGPIGIESFDFDNDGDLDLVASSHGADSVSVLEGNGSGTFQAAQNFLVGDGPFAVVSGDVDGNGYTDLIAVNETTSTISVLTNNSGTTFDAKVDYSVGTTPKNAKLVDVNGDGDLDILTVDNGGTATVTYLENAGDGTFALAYTYDATGGAFGFNAGDLNDDEIIDFVVGSSGNTFLQVVELYDGPLVTSVTPAQNAANISANSNVIVNFDEVLGTSSFTSSSFIVEGSYSGTHTGTFSFSNNDQTVTFNPTNDFETGEIVTVSVTSSAEDSQGNDLPEPYVFQFTIESSGIGDFALLTNYEVSATNTDDITTGLTADFDGDGHPDIAALDETNTLIKVFFNDGDGTFDDASTTISLPSNPKDVKAADIDNDGDIDLLTANNNAAGFSIIKNNGNSTFASRTDISYAGATTIALGDVDNDGDEDAIINNAGTDQLLTFYNNGSGTFGSTPDSSTISADITDILILDSNEDGYQDVITISSGSFHYFYLSLNDGDGTFTIEDFEDATGSLTSLAYGHVSSDLMFGAASPGNNAFTRLQVQAAGTEFTTDFNNSTGSNPQGIVFSDFSDTNPFSINHMDAITANYTDSTFSLHEWSTNTVSFSQSTYSLPSNPWDVATADFDNDGNMDIVTFNTNGQISVMFNEVSTPPTIWSSTPVNNLERVAISSNLSVSFSQAMDEATFDSSSIVVMGNLNGQYNTTFSYNSGTNVLTLDPSTNFLPGENVSVTITTDVENEIGIALSSPYFYQFNVLGTIDYISENDIKVSSTDPYGAEFADVDLDGDLDLISINGEADSVSIRLNDGSGNFTTLSQYQTGSGPYGLETGDFDRINGIDFVVTNFSSNTVSVFTNNGSGSFSASSYGTGTNPIDVVTEDFNKDGHLDIIVFNRSSANATILVNDGDGTFTSSGTISSLGTNKEFIWATDIDDDNDMDIATGGGSGTTLSIAKNNGDGTFVAGSTTTITADGAAFADIDEDGEVDLIVANEAANTVSVYLNDGDETFDTASDVITVSSAEALTILDFENNGDLDILVMSYDDGILQLLTNDGSGDFTAGATFNVGTNPRTIAAADIDGDGDLDFATANRNSDNISINYGTDFVEVTSFTPTLNTIGVSATSNITATFNSAMNSASFTSSTVIVNGSYSGMITGVFSYDSPSKTMTFNPDSSFKAGEEVTVSITTGVENSNGVSLTNPEIFTFSAVAGGDGYFTYALESSVFPNQVSSLYGADLDGDGDQDMVGTYNNYFSVRFNDGSGSYGFGTASDYSMSGGGGHIIPADLDNDGDIDVLAMRANSRYLVFMENNGSGAFSRNDSIATNQVVVGGRWGIGDFNNDGIIDVAMVDYTGSAYAIYIYTNDGAMNFTSYYQSSDLSGNAYVDISDLDNDGHLDFILSDRYESFGTILNNGDGTLGSETTISAPSGSTTRAIAADLNGDKYQDIIVSNAYANDGSSFSIYLNQGDGTVASSSNTSMSFDGFWVRNGDMDGDDDLDVILGRSNALIIGYNDGSGTIEEIISYSTSGSNSGAAVFDYDGDGDLDIVNPNFTNVSYLTNVLPVTPSSAVTSLSFTNIFAEQVTANWSNGDGTGRMVVAKQGSAVDATPTDDVFYSASNFGSGSELGTGNYVVYTGTGSTTDITGLTPDSTYHFAVFEYNKGNTLIKYLTTSPATGNVTTRLYPTTASTISIDSDQGTRLSLSWSGGDGSKQLVTIKEGSASTWEPTDSTNYIANNSFSSATNQGGDSTKVISNDNTGSVTVTDLNLSTTYYIEVFEYNGDAGFENYLRTSTGTLNTTTQSVEGSVFDTTAGYAYQFDGGTKEYYAEIYLDGTAVENQFTTELWVKPQSLGVEQLFLTEYSLDIAMGINSSNKFFAYSVQNGTDATTITVTGTTTISEDVWYHVALTGEAGGNLTLYVNGEAEDSAAVDDISGDDDYDDYWYLGSDYDESYYFYGYADELRIWSSVRTPSEIRSFMHRPYFGFTDQLIGYWQLNEGTGDGTDAVNSYGADFYNEDGWTRSTAPVGGSIMNKVSSIQTGTLALGNVSIQLSNAFDNAVDIYAFEIPSTGTIFGDEAYAPSGYNTLFGDSYYVINVFGDPGIFVANLTLNFGAGTIPSEYDSAPDSLALFTRGSNTDSAWVSLGGADAVSSASGTATWNGLDTFSQFAVVDTSNLAPSSVTFTKSNFADATLEANQDRIAYDIWITRGDDDKLFNAHSESSVSNGVSPARTQWAYGTTADSVESLTFDDFDDLVSSEAKNLPGKSLVMYLYEHDEYIDVLFNSWTNGSSNGGGFSYTRTTVNIPDPEPITFDSTAGYALIFDGTDDYMYYSTYSAITEDYDDMPDPVTFEMWVNVDSLTDGKMVLAASRGTTFQIGIDSTDHFYGYFRDSNFGWKRSRSTTTVNEEEWYHLAISVESNDFIKLYVNGTIEDSTSTPTMRTGADDYYFGKSRFLESGGYHYFDGKMDEVRIWQEARTDSAIRTGMFSSNVIADKTEILSYWQMNEGTGNTVEDLANDQDLDLDQDGAGFQPAWVVSDVPVGGGTPQITSNFQNGSVSVGNASLNMSDGFDNPVDVQVTEVSSDPNQFPSGFTSGVGGKYFVINLYGDPGTFSANLTLTFGSGVITADQAATPSQLKLYRRSSNSTGAWTEIAEASSANESTGVVTWNGITTFSQFMSVYDEFDLIQQADTTLVFYSDSTTMISGDFFDFETGYEDSTLTFTIGGNTSGTFFIDQNSNGAYNSGTDSLFTASTSFNYTASGTNELYYNNTELEKETIALILESAAYSDTIDVNFATVEATPTFSNSSDSSSWYMVANPFDTPIGTLLENIWTQGAVNADASSGSPNLYVFNQDSAEFEAVTTDLDTTKLAAGEGLLAYFFVDDDYTDGNPPVGGGWPKTLSNYGNPFSTDAVTVTLKNNDKDNSTTTNGDEGWALMGNPYGWYVRVDSVLATIQRDDPTASNFIYIWDSVNKEYTVSGSGSITPYQSFFVRLVTSGVTANVSLGYDDYYDNSPIEKQIASPAVDGLRFTLNKKGSDYTSESFITFKDEGSAGIDKNDAYHLQSLANKYAHLYTEIEELNLMINNLPLALTEKMEYPLYIDSNMEGDFELSWDSESIPEGWIVHLTHVASGSTYDLNETQRIDFSHRLMKKEAKVGDELRNVTRVTMLDASPKFTLTVIPAIAVSNENDLGIPTVLELEQNYPNPFNPSSVIRFGVPTASQVQLEVFDILGRKVAVILKNELRQPGRYNIKFDGRNLASGMYIYRLVVGDKVLTKKMTLIK